MNNTSVALAAKLATFKQWLGLAVLVLPTILLALDMTVLHLAVPHLSADLNPSGIELLWILDIYGFLIAGFLIVMGTLGDRIGRRRLLLCGAVAFGLASVMAAFSTSAHMLIINRAILGIAGATLMPSTLSLIRNMFEVEKERTRAISIWMTGFIVGSAIGPVVGGFLLEYFWWGSVFLLGVPVMLLLLIAGIFILPEFKDEQAGKLDLGSAVLSVVVLLLLIFGLKEISHQGFTFPVITALFSGLLLGWLFIVRQKKSHNPMLDLTLFHNPLFSSAITACMLSIMAMSGAWLMVYQFLQGVLMLSPLDAGLVMLPAAIIQMIAAQLVPSLISRFRPVFFIVAGLLIAVVGFVLIAQAGLQQSAFILVLGSIVMGLGVMPMMIMGTDLVVSSAPAEKAGVASAISETANELGLALGVAFIGSIGAVVYQQNIYAALHDKLPQEQVQLAGDTLGAALQLSHNLSSLDAARVVEAAHQAFSEALWVNAMLGVVLIFIAAIVAAIFLRHVAVPATH